MAKNNKKRNAAEDRELEEAFRKMTGKKAGNKKEKKGAGVTIAVCVSILAIVLCIGGVFFYMVQREMNRVVAGNISVAGVQLQGMTQADAIKAVDAKFKPQDMTVTVLDHSVTIPADCIQDLDTRKAVRAACDMGATTAAQSLDLSAYLTVDEDRIRGYIAELCAHYDAPLQQSSYQITGSAPNQILQITLGTPEYGLDTEQLYLNVLAAFTEGQSAIEGKFTLMEPAPIDLDAIHAANSKSPVDAYYDKATGQIAGGEDGCSFDLDAAKKTLANAKYGETIEIPFTAVAPAITREAAEKTLFKDVLGTFTAKSSSKSNRDNNLALACKAINGLVLNPGDKFSYNETLGERTPEKGYKPAGTYIGNETVNTYGGGICQVSSCLYYSVLMAELKVNERTNHGFLPSYMPRGLDATVNWGTLDFKFENNTDYPIRIEATAKGGTTTITLKGTETRNYRVELKASILSKTSYETEYQVMEPNNKEGYKNGDVIVTPHSGYYVESYIYRYALDTGELISKDYIDDSRYRVRNKVVCKIESGTTTPEGGTTTPDGGTTAPDSGTTTPEQPGGETPTPPPAETPSETPTP